MAVIRLREVTSDDLISVSIRRICECDYSHIGALTDDLSQEFGARYDGGVKYRPENYDKFTLIKVFSLNVTQQQHDDFWAFLNAQNGKPYDTTAIEGILVDRNWRDDDSWFCSELITAGLEQAKIIQPLDYTINHVTPAHDLILLSAMIGKYF